MGQKIQLAETFTGSGLPVLYPDSIMSSGSLALMDVGHSQGGFSGYLNNTQIPNIAASVAAGLTSSTTSGVALNLNYGLGNNPAGFAAERTGKGGLHVATSQAGTMVTTGSAGYYNFVSIDLPTAIINYIFANPSHSYYISLWHRITRAALSGATSPAAIIGQPSPASRGLIDLPQFGTGPATATTSYAISGGAYNGVANLLEQLAATWGGTAPSGSGASLEKSLFGWGPYLAKITGAFGQSNGLNASRSAILYRAYIEDLTVSGRSYATVAAIDAALWATAFGSGGKFNGDTFTAAATLMP